MRLRDFLSIYRRRPFAPFKVYLSSGESYEVSHPDYVDASDEFLVITTKGTAENPVPYSVYCSWLHVAHIDRQVQE